MDRGKQHRNREEAPKGAKPHTRKDREVRVRDKTLKWRRKARADRSRLSAEGAFAVENPTILKKDGGGAPKP
jgi:hypothetical protein